MKKLFFLLIVINFFSDSIAQKETVSYKNISQKFQIYYNENKYDSIFNLFSNEMQTALPANKTSEFLSGLKSSAGLINRMEFIRYQSSYASYKTSFERALYALSLSLDNNSKINGFYVKVFTDETLPLIKRNTTPLKLPFNGEWTVVWGGDTKELNYHVESEAQKNAFDILIKDKAGSTHRSDGQNNDDYYAFGKEIISPCAGEVVLMVDGIKDNKPGELNPIYVPGNSVIIRTVNNEYLLFAHFKHQSIKVKEGDKISIGQLLGLCGNSGNSSEPHLHFHIQNVENMNVATGVKCYFEAIKVNGEIRKDYSPIKGEKISNH